MGIITLEDVLEKLLNIDINDDSTDQIARTQAAREQLLLSRSRLYYLKHGVSQGRVGAGDDESGTVDEPSYYLTNAKAGQYKRSKSTKFSKILHDDTMKKALHQKLKDQVEFALRPVDMKLQHVRSENHAGPEANGESNFETDAKEALLHKESIN